MDILKPKFDKSPRSFANFARRSRFFRGGNWYIYSIVTFLVGDSYKPSFATVTGWGVDPRYIKHP